MGGDFKWQRRISLQHWATLEGAKETWYREERSWENHVEKEIPETLDLKEPERRPCKLPYWCIPTLLKMEFEGGGVVLKFHFKIPFLQSCFLNDQYSSSFHLRGLITIPGFPSKKKWNSTGWFCPPALPLYRGRDTGVEEHIAAVSWFSATQSSVSNRARWSLFCRRYQVVLHTSYQWWQSKGLLHPQTSCCIEGTEVKSRSFSQETMRCGTPCSGSGPTEST